MVRNLVTCHDSTSGPCSGDSIFLRSSERILELCENIWNGVKPLLCADAPEGLSISNDVSLDFDQDKETLSFCWRALQESR